MILCAGLVLAWLSYALSPSSIITTAAGGGAGDGGAATGAILDVPQGVAVDATGNVYIADTLNYRVRKIDANGTISTVAGDGTAGYSGDGGAATSAQLSSPQGVAVDAAGNLYIADSGNNRIRKVDTHGIISTIAGNGLMNEAGDGGPAGSAQLSQPAGIAVDGQSNLYIADYSGSRVRKINTSGIISTVAGNGTSGYAGDGGAATSAELNNPYAVAVDASGNLYIADTNNARIRKVDTAGTISTIAGNGFNGYSGDGGAATSAQLQTPTGVAIDGAGNLYIADHDNSVVRKVSAGGTITTFAGTGALSYSGDGAAATAAAMNRPIGVAIAAGGRVVISDWGNNRIRQVDAGNIITTIAGNGSSSFFGDGGAATKASLSYPYGVAINVAGNIYISDGGNYRVRKIDAAGTITTFAGNGTYADSGDGGAATSASLMQPDGLAIDAQGNLYIADEAAHKVRKVAANGTITTVAGNGTAGDSGDGGFASVAQLNSPSGVAVDAAGNLYIADYLSNRVRKVAVSGLISTVAGNGTHGYAGDGAGATNAQLYFPGNVAVDADGNFYIADTFNCRVRKVDASGTIRTVAGNGACSTSGDGGPATSAGVGNPLGLAFDALGNLYVSDNLNNGVRMIDSNGVISTVAGTGHAGFSGDGGAAVQAQLYGPIGIALDAAGDLYIVDDLNNRVRKVTPAFNVGGSVSGLAGQGLVLSLNGGAQTLAIAANGSFVFPARVANGSSYSISVQTQPSAPAQTCTVSGGSGTISGADAISSEVVCGTLTHTVTPSVQGVGGTIAPAAPQSVADGATASFTLNPEANYAVDAVSGSCGGGLSGNTYTTAAITADCTVVATFTANTAPIDGICGSDNGKTLASLPMNLCSAGTPSAVAGDGPWTWACVGSNGGTTATCAAAATPFQTVTSLIANPDPAAIGQSVTLRVFVNGLSTHAPNSTASSSTATPQALPDPSGTATVSDGTNTCTAAINNNGSGSCTLTFTAAGIYHLVARYSGDANYAGSNATLDLSVAAVAGGAATVSAPMLDRRVLLLLALSLGALASRRLSRRVAQL